MADALVSALVGTIVTNLSNEVLKHYAIFTGLNPELQKLSDTFDHIKGVLYDAEAKQWNSGSEGTEGEPVKTWLRLLKHAAYDADDVIDDLYIEVQRCQQQGGFIKHGVSFSLLRHNPIGSRVKMARKLKSLRERLDVIYENQPRGLNVGSPQSALEWRLTTSFVDDSEICGRVDEKAKLINDLISSSETLSVHALCGMGGLGKTTLAQLVYNAKDIEAHFPLRMWVCVSDNTDLRSLMRAIIGDRSNSREELDSLQQHLLKKLDGERFLLVLDDVWEDFPDKWDRLKNAVKSGATGSVVLITTRIRQVAEKMRTVSICNMGRLSDDDSWSLFTIRAFGTRASEEQETFIKFQEGIVKKCGGVPLVLKLMGSMMQLKKTENEWSNVMESELWNLADKGENILATLKLSYIHLPMNLKQCFSYCCIYPKDYVMKKEELIQLWMANDFISCRGRKSLHETGKEIFSELVARSFFQNVETDYLGNATCKMHDLLHDVATSVMEHELHLIQLGESLKGGKVYRHVSCSCDAAQFVTLMKGNSKIPSLRSIFFTPTDDKNMEVKWLSTQKNLRILSLNGLRLEKLPTSLSKHLRYLDVSRSFINGLPESICSLYKLQTLNLRSCCHLKQLPKGMKEMESLMYLDIKGCDSLKGMPPGMGQLKSMRKLSKFIVGKKDRCKIDELKRLNDLEGELSISGLDNVKNVAEAESSNMTGKNMLMSLKLIWKESCGIIDMEVLSSLQPHRNLRKLVICGYGSLKLPKWMMDLSVHLPHLVKMKLRKFLQCKQLQIPLGRLDSLKDLELSEMPCVELIGVEVYGDGETAAFPSLEILVLDRMGSLKEWAEIITTSASSSSCRADMPFPRLRDLLVKGCPLLTKFPIIPSVQSLSLDESTATTSELAVLVQANFVGLKSLSLKLCDGLENLPELDPHQNVCSLENLKISWCSRLKSLPNAGLWCSSLVRHLMITGCPELMTLSEDGLRHLTALQTLRFYECPKITSLPESIQHLTALAILDIRRCSLDLERRCEKEKGEDWPKIAHISDICINLKQIQGDFMN